MLLQGIPITHRIRLKAICIIYSIHSHLCAVGSNCIICCLQCIFKNVIIAVYKYYILSLHFIKGKIARRACTAILLMKQTDSCVTAGILPAHRIAVICRTVINNDYLNIIKCLADYTVKASWQIFLCIIYRNYDRYLYF